MVAIDARTPSDRMLMMAVRFCLVIWTSLSIRNGSSAVVTSVMRLKAEMINVMLTVIVTGRQVPVTSPHVAAMGWHCRRMKKSTKMVETTVTPMRIQSVTRCHLTTAIRSRVRQMLTLMKTRPLRKKTCHRNTL